MRPSTGGPLKIAIDARALSTPYEHRGVGFYVKSLVRGLPAMAPDIEFVFLTAGESAMGYIPALPNVTFRRLTRTWKRVWLEDMIKLPGEIRASGAHAVHFPVVLGPLREVNIPWRSPVPVISTVHDLHVECLDDPHMEAYRRELRYRVQRWAVKRTRIVAISEFTRERIAENRIMAKDRVAVIPISIRPEAAPPAEKENLILFIGDTAHKNTAAALTVFLALSSRIPGWRFVMVGSRERIYALAGGEAKALQAARILQIEENIPDVIMEDLFGKARILFMPSLSEGFGVPVLHAFAHGACPVISDCGSLPEVGGDAAVYVNPRDVAEMVSTLEGLCKNPSLRANLLERGARRLGRFTWEEHLGRLVQLYREISAK